MAFVLDASITVAWAFPDEKHPLADLAFASLRSDEVLVPALWWFEVRNVLVVNERRGRIDPSQTEIFLKALGHFRIRIDREPNEADVLRIARTEKLSVYDAAYLELAYRAKLPLATLDRKLEEAARVIGVNTFGTKR